MERDNSAWEALRSAAEKTRGEAKSYSAQALAALPDAALVIVDMNNGFAKAGALYSPRVEALIPGIAQLARAFREAGKPIVAYTDSHAAGSIEYERYPEHCRAGSWESEIVPELREYVTETIEKDSTNACLAVGERRFDAGATVVIVGDCTDICILQYALAQRIRMDQAGGGRVIVAANLLDTFDAPGHPADALQSVALYLMQNGGVEIAQCIA